MNFDELDKKMRIYEQSLDQVFVPDMYMVATIAKRSRIHVEYELPLGNDYGTMIRQYV